MVHIRFRIHQQLHDLSMAIHDSCYQRRYALLNQCLNGILSSQEYDLDWSIMHDISLVLPDITSYIAHHADKYSHHNTAIKVCTLNWRISYISELVHICFRIDQHFHHFNITSISGCSETRSTGLS